MKISFSPITLLPLPLVLGMLLLSCARPTESPDGDSPGQEVQSELQFEGVVQYRQVEGAAWVIESEDGTTYEPTDLPEDYREQGLPVRVWANRLEDRASIRMVGPIISIERIERRGEE